MSQGFFHWPLRYGQTSKERGLPMLFGSNISDDMGAFYTPSQRLE